VSRYPLYDQLLNIPLPECGVRGSPDNVRRFCKLVLLFCYLFLPRKPLRGAVNGMTWLPSSIGSGSQIVPVIKSRVWFVPGQHAIQVPLLKIEASSGSPRWAAWDTISVSRHTSFSFLISSNSRKTLLIVAQTCSLRGPFHQHGGELCPKPSETDSHRTPSLNRVDAPLGVDPRRRSTRSRALCTAPLVSATSARWSVPVNQRIDRLLIAPWGKLARSGASS
jgi:hypothetical protein